MGGRVKGYRYCLMVFFVGGGRARISSACEYWRRVDDGGMDAKERQTLVAC